MPKKKKITKEQLEQYVLDLMRYRDEGLQPYIEELQAALPTATSGSNPPTPPPKPPILK